MVSPGWKWMSFWSMVISVTIYFIVGELLAVGR